MPLRLFIALLFIAVLPVKNSLAQVMKTDTVVPIKTSEIAPVSKLPYVIVYPGDDIYPTMLAKNGVQGTVILEINLSKDGKVKSARVLSSSNSGALDDNALAYSKTAWALPNNGLKYFEGTYSLSIVFVRDSILTINKKTCADFNTDYRYFRFIRPSGNIKNIGALELLANLFAVQLVKEKNAETALKFVKSQEAINNETVLACSKKPSELLVKTYAKAANARGIKF